MQLSFMHAANINKLFDNLQLLGKPTHNLIEECLSFAFCVDERAINAAVVVKMIEWIGGMSEEEQDYLSGVLLKKSKLLESRRLMSDHQCIDKVGLLIIELKFLAIFSIFILDMFVAFKKYTWYI